MTDVLIEAFENEAGDQRVLIVRRADGAFTYRMQFIRDRRCGGEGPDCGVYDSTETAESEARARVPWLTPPFH